MEGIMDDGMIDQWIFPKEFIDDVQSFRFQNMTLAKELETRFKTVWFMSDLSNALRPRTRRDGTVIDAESEYRNMKVFWTAAVFFQRFFLFHSFESHNRFFMAVACLFLAAKAEEKPLRLKDHITMYFKVRKNSIPNEEERAKAEKMVLNSERVLLQTLNFDLNVVHPAAYFRSIINRELKNCFADADVSKQVMRLATTILSDSLRSTLCLEYSPKQLSYAILFVAITVLSLEPMNAAGKGGVDRVGNGLAVMPSPEESWLDLLDRQMDEIVLKNISFRIVEMYSQPTMRPSDAIKLEQSASVKVNIAEFAKESHEARLRRCSVELDGGQTDSSALSTQTLSPTVTDHSNRFGYSYQQQQSKGNDLSAGAVANSQRHLKPLNDEDSMGIAESKSNEEVEGAMCGGMKRKRSGSLGSGDAKKEAKKFAEDSGCNAPEIDSHRCDGTGDSMFDYDLPAETGSGATGTDPKPEDTPGWVSTPNFEHLPRPGIA